MRLSSRARKTIGLCALAATLLAFPFASSALAIGHGRGVFYGGFYPGWGWGWGPYSYYGWAPYYYDYRGTVKLEDAARTDAVYINGSYAGSAKKLHSIELNPGSYRITVKNQEKTIVDKTVYVLTGKTIKVEVGDKPQG